MRNAVRIIAILLLLSWVGGCTVGAYVDSTNVSNGGIYSAIMLYLMYLFFKKELND